MNIKNFNIWTKALRFGGYEQTDGALFGIVAEEEGEDPVYGYCCLGVGCEVADMDEVLGRGWREDALAPLEFIKWLDLPVMRIGDDRRTYIPCTIEDLNDDDEGMDIAIFPNREGHVTAAGMNDASKSFRVIATWLEKNRDRLVAYIP